MSRLRLAMESSAKCFQVFVSVFLLFAEVLRADIEGALKMKACLSGMPEARKARFRLEYSFL